MRSDFQERRLARIICATAAAAALAAAVPASASAAPAEPTRPVAAAAEEGCTGASRKMDPNGADAICITGAAYITVHITCVMVTTATYYDRSGDRVWSSNGNGGSRVYCDFPGDPLLEHSFSLG